MRIFSLASGSGGNAYCFESEGEILLVDCGISCRELHRRCEKAGLDPAAISSVVFTHNHTDHVKGLATFHSRHPDAALYANMMTADAIAAVTEVEDFCVFENGQEFAAGRFAIRPFSIPHDVPDPVGFMIRAEGVTCFHATDVGTPLDSIGSNLAEADYAILESNHDPVMLAQSARPESLKRRIRGGRGHLSNEGAAALAARFASPSLRVIGLAHLSSECNAPHLALAAMREALSEAGRTSIRLIALSQDGIFELTAPGAGEAVV